MVYPPEAIVAISIILPLLTLCAVSLRFWVRMRVAPAYLGVDDWCCAAACILAMADGANLIVDTVLGSQGRNYPGEVPSKQNIVDSRSDHAQLILEKPLYCLVKLNVLLFYRRIFVVDQQWRTFNNAMIVLVMIWTLFYLLAEIFVCGVHFAIILNPGKANTPPSPPTCFNTTNLNFSFAITDAVFDMLVIGMPYPCIRKMHIGRREKLGVAGIFLMGALSTVASIVRLGFISKAFTLNYGGMGNQHDVSTPPAVWSTVEGALGVLAGCLPPLGPLIRKVPGPKRLSGPWRSLNFGLNWQSSTSKRTAKVITPSTPVEQSCEVEPQEKPVAEELVVPMRQWNEAHD